MGVGVGWEFGWEEGEIPHDLNPAGTVDRWETAATPVTAGLLTGTARLFTMRAYRVASAHGSRPWAHGYAEF